MSRLPLAAERAVSTVKALALLAVSVRSVAAIAGSSARCFNTARSIACGAAVSSGRSFLAISLPFQVLLAAGATAASAVQGKEAHAAVGSEALAHLTSLALPITVVTSLRLYSGLGLPSLHPPAVNLVVSNVPGPNFPLYFAGRRADRLYALGPIFDGAPLNVTAVSFDGTLGIGLIACPDRLPDLDALADALEAIAGAIHLDAGNQAAQQFAAHIFAEDLRSIGKGDLEANPKGLLQEQIQSVSTESLVYTIIGEEGPDHAKQFVAAVSWREAELGRGSGRSKKDAETQAAQAALDNPELKKRLRKACEQQNQQTAQTPA